jgi:hypothetical protein
VGNQKVFVACHVGSGDDAAGSAVRGEAEGSTTR